MAAALSPTMFDTSGTVLENSVHSETPKSGKDFYKYHARR